MVQPQAIELTHQLICCPALSNVCCASCSRLHPDFGEAMLQDAPPGPGGQLPAVLRLCGKLDMLDQVRPARHTYTPIPRRVRMPHAGYTALSSKEFGGHPWQQMTLAYLCWCVRSYLGMQRTGVPVMAACRCCCACLRVGTRCCCSAP